MQDQRNCHGKMDNEPFIALLRCADADDDDDEDLCVPVYQLTMRNLCAVPKKNIVEILS